MKRVVLKSISLTLIFSLAYQLLFPVAAYALTSGPSQPEVQEFEPVGTTEMVDLFSGDFVYNIPLMDIDGYPINISYHSGVTPEQEASWVGLGWSLNPGEINRSVRGIPDDFNGDNIEKKVQIQPEKNFMGMTGVELGAEIFGLDPKEMGIFDLSVNFSMYMNANNYKGLSAGTRAGVSVALRPSTGNGGPGIGFSPSIGVGSQSGVDVDASLSFSLTSKANDKGVSSSVAIGVGSGINSRVGMKALNFNVSHGLSQSRNDRNKAAGIDKTEKGKVSSQVFNAGVSVPIGLQNYVPVVTNSSKLLSYYIQLKVGAEVYGLYPHFLTGLSASQMSIDDNGSRNAYGYMYMENAAEDKSGILDFIRDKDGMYNKTMTNLPMSSLAYDVFAVSGQGTGGNFRPFRNDIGTVYDPYTTSSSDNLSAAIEFGFANLFEIGANVTNYSNEVSSGPWITADFHGEQANSVYEKLFYKQAGELTYNNQIGTSASPQNTLFSGTDPLKVTANYSGSDLYVKGSNASVTLSNATSTIGVSSNIGYTSMNNARTPRANLINVYTSEKAAIKGVLPDQFIKDYGGTTPNPSNPTINPITRTTTAGGKKDRINAISQLLPDGRRYIYGVPAMNNITKDVTFGYMPSQSYQTTGGNISGVTLPSDNSSSPDPEKYYSHTITPAYAHAFLLTDILSADYVDITGNGCSDDDLGGYVKINYDRTSSDYRWRAPVGTGNVHFDPGFQSDPNDGRANVSLGSREQWYVSTIESKNLVAEFYIHERSDAKGSGEAISGTYGAKAISDATQSSYKLDSIRLFNKSHRLTMGTNAVPIKTVIFKYDYSLCPNTPNSLASGKLTLKNIYIRYGNSDKNLLNPYQFRYNTLNPSYNYELKDRWGMYKTNPPGISNYEFPYAAQDVAATENQDYAASYNLTDITLPSGGKLKVVYEPDDYAYVQDKRAMQMVFIAGFGSGPNLNTGNVLYEDKDKQFNYVYFHRLANDGLTGTSTNSAVRAKYLEGQKHLYYAASVDVRAGMYEQIKGFGKIMEGTDDVGLCPGNTDYVYVRLEKTSSSDIDFNPVALYAMNFCRLNINHIFYPGYGENSPLEVLKAFRLAAEEIKHMRRPHRTFVERGYCKNVQLNKSWIRVQTPGLNKKGGGIRVKELRLDDQWNEMTGSTAQQSGHYGKHYDYTIDDDRYGTISSGVASYEPMVGGDENPLRSPVPYLAAQNVAFPSVEFYQLEPLGENFYPGGMVGYSSVRVRSVNISQGKSSMSEDENLFYTAKDFPVRVSFTAKEGKSYKDKKLFVQKTLEQASQGYTLFLNDMHGKPKAENHYVVTEYNSATAKVLSRELVSGTTYYYNQDNQGHLDSKVMAMMRDGSNAVIRQMELGRETDLSLDSRQHYDNSQSLGANISLNTVIYGVYPVPIPMVFPTYSTETNVFNSMVATKLVQQYGILKKVETVDHGAKTSIENLVYDGETGNILLSRTNNEFNDYEYMQKVPAYYKYDGMGPAYTNIGFKEQPVRLYVNRLRNGYMETDNTGVYVPGDELLYSKGTTNEQLWVLGKNTVGLSEYYGFNTDPTKGYILFVADPTSTGITISETNAGTKSTAVYNNDIWNLDFSSSNYFELTPGSYSFTFHHSALNSSGQNFSPVQINGGQLTIVQLSFLSDCSHGDIGINGPCITKVFFNNTKCLLKVAPRHTIEYDLGSATNSGWWWSPANAKMFTGFTTEILRSGRRNMGLHTIEEINTTTAPTYTDGTTLTNFLVKTGLISATAQTYTDAANAYDNFDARLDVPNATTDPDKKVREGYNDYVMGLKGNWRPLAQYTPLASRTYTAQAHTRGSGIFSLSSLYWSGSTYSNNTCGAIPYYVQASGITSEWKQASMVTLYDMFGNSLEERDALGVYSSALYGYNMKLPTAVAANARHENIMFESFEDMNSIAIPEYLRRIFYNFTVTNSNTASGGTSIGTARSAPDYLHSPFAKLFYTQVGTLTMNGQRYYRSGYTIPGNNNIYLVNGSGHTGSRYLNISGSQNITIPLENAVSENKIAAFAMVKNKKYIASFWKKTTSTALHQAGFIAGSQSFDFVAKGKPIEGWQLMEAEVDLSTIQQSLTAIQLNFMVNMYVDDIRIMPMDANMKCFVYDYETGRLQAQLDENHYATFYEYDQEGQLVRVKKETEQGILTISENRRAMHQNY